MYRNRNLNLNGVFSYNQLVVNGVDVAPTIKNNKQDISFIYNESLVTVSNDNINNSSNVQALSALTESNNTILNDVNNQVSVLQAQINNLQRLMASNQSGGPTQVGEGPVNAI